MQNADYYYFQKEDMPRIEKILEEDKKQEIEKKQIIQ